MHTIDRRNLLLAAAATGLGASFRPASGRAALLSPAAPDIPATAAGTHLAWALDQINNGGGDLSVRALDKRFSEEFLSALPANDLKAVFTSYLAPNGPMTLARFEGAVTETLAKAILITPGPDWRVTIGTSPDDPSRIDQLFFEPVGLPPELPKQLKSWTPIEKRLANLAPLVSFQASELDGDTITPLFEVEPEQSLAIGSAFKQYVLAELARQIADGTASWDELLPVRNDLRSLPNGAMRLEPAGARFPLQHFAEQMISASDNTATDHLIDRLGRERVEAAFGVNGNTQPDRNLPLLMTREWFALKLRYTPKQIERYLKLSVDKKRAELAGRVQTEAATLSELEDWVGTYFIEEIEWFASAADLTRVLANLHAIADRPGYGQIHDAYSMHPGIAFDARTWAYVGYKGGYETGVTSGVWLLQRGDGRWFSIAAIINDPEEEADAGMLYQLMLPMTRLLASLA